MSGVEVVSLISATITFIRAAQDIYKTAKDAKGLPEAVREVAARLPIIENILNTAKQNIEGRSVNEEECNSIKPIIESCNLRAKKLEELFNEAVPKEGERDLRRYWKAVKKYGQGNQVEKLMKGLLEDMQLLHCEHGL